MGLSWRGNAPLPKVSLPAPADSVLQRPELMQQLLDAPAGVWVGSPSASGKTVLASSALRAHALPAFWMQLDQGDNDAGSFFHFAGLAASRVEGAQRKPPALPVYGREVGESLVDFARAWFRAMHARLPPGCVMVFDDWQAIAETNPLQQILAPALNELPAGHRLWLLSRHAPPAALDSARVRGRLTVLDFSDLALSVDEVQALLSRGIPAVRQTPRPAAEDAEQRAERWHRWCEGWVGALVFALAAGRNEPAALPPAMSSGTAATLFGFLGAELFEAAGPALREFMLLSAWMPFISEPLARQAMPDIDTRAAIDALLRQSLLLAVDDDVGGSSGGHHSWRYHRLLREFLQQRSREQWGEDIHATRLAALADTLRDAALPEAAAGLYMTAGHWPGLVQQLLQQAPGLLRSGRTRTLAQWAEALPETARTPWVRYWHASALNARDTRLGMREFERAYDAFWAAGDAEGLYRSWCGVIEAITYACDDYGALELWLQRLRQLRRRFPRVPSLMVRAEVSVYGFSATFFLRPQAPEFANWLRNVQRFYRLSPRRSDRAAIGGLLGLYHTAITGMGGLGAHLQSLRPLLDDPAVPPFHRLVGGLPDVIHHWIAGDTEQALQRLAIYTRLAQDTGTHAIDRQYAFQHVYVHCLRGELDAADQHLKRLASQLGSMGQLDVAQHQFLTGWRAALGGRLDEAVHLLQAACDNARQRRFAFFEAISRGLLAELLAVAGDAEAARHHADEALASARELGSVTAQVACLMQRAVVAERAGMTDTALATLIAEAFAHAQRHGHYGYGGLMPASLSRLVQRALALGVAPDFVRELVRRRALLPPAPIAAGTSESWPWPLKLRGFGPLQVLLDEEDLSATKPGRSLDLLRALLCVLPSPLPVNTALAWLWPETTGADQRKVFDVAVHRLRKLLGDERLLRLEGGKLALDAQRVWTDVGALAEVIEAQAAGKLSAAEAIHRLSSLLRGRLLDGDDTPWIQAAREVWRRRLAHASLRMTETLATQPGGNSTERGLLQSIFNADPAAEPVARRLMLCLLSAGDAQQAAQVLQLCNRVRQLGGEPPLAPLTLELAARHGLQLSSDKHH